MNFRNSGGNPWHGPGVGHSKLLSQLQAAYDLPRLGMEDDRPNVPYVRHRIGATTIWGNANAYYSPQVGFRLVTVEAAAECACGECLL